MPIGLAESMRRTAAQHRTCIVPGCHKPVYRLGSYCKSHQRNKQRHGTPTADPIRAGMLKFYAKRTSKFLKANRQHPAVVAVIDKLDQMLADAAARPIIGKPRRGDFRTQVLLEYQRLHHRGVMGEKILGRLLAIAYMADQDPARLEPMSIPYRYAVARLVLRMVGNRYRDNKAGTALGSRVLNTIGQQLIEATWLIAREMLKSFKAADEEPRKFRDGIAKAIEQTPLVAPRA